MDSNKFIKELKESLIEGGIDHKEIDDTVNYYKEYFNDKIRAGATEQDVLDELGEPRLIAKTIIETSDSSKSKNNNYRDNNSYSTSYEYDTYADDKQYRSNSTTKVFTIKNKILSALILIGIVLLVIGFFIFAIKILYILLPFILIYGLVRYILK